MRTSIKKVEKMEKLLSEETRIKYKREHWYASDLKLVMDEVLMELKIVQEKTESNLTYVKEFKEEI